MTGALAIFVKTPGHSPVKSRLAADCGEDYATQWYRHAARAVASVARIAQARYGLTAYWAVAEPDALHAWPDLPALAQGGGGLGARMAQVHAQLVARHGLGLLVGADAPQLSAALLGEAAQWLSSPSPRLLLGPAHDGGFWLFGSNIVPPLVTWTGVGYSAPDTARDLHHAMRQLGTWRTLAGMTDVDRGHDLRAVLHALETLPAPTAEQRTLADWMREHEGDREATHQNSGASLSARHPREGGDPVPLGRNERRSLDPRLRGDDESEVYAASVTNTTPALDRSAS